MPELNQFPWVGGHRALDFSNTIEWVDGEVDIEWLGDYERLIEWMCRAHLISETTESDYRALAGRERARAAEVYAEVLRLRDAVLTICIHRERDPAALATITRFAVEAHAQRSLHWVSDAFVWSYTDQDLRMPLWRLALEAADLLTSPQFAQVRQCAADDCSFLFLDNSRTGKRRWCDMATCGNRAKARRHYTRKRD